MDHKIISLAKEILAEGYLMSLGTVDEHGPWVSDVIYVHDEDFRIYWISGETTRHSVSIQCNKKVSGTITTSNGRGEQNIGLQFEGVAEKIKGDIFKMAIKHREKRGKAAPEKEGEILDEGEAWYCLTPTKIELIYEPLFGFEKKSVLL